MTPKQPATEAGRALLADILAAHFGPDDLLADRILAIEAEAAAGLTSHPDDGHDHSWGCRRCGVDPPEATND